jgi:hypothetical protein
VLERDRRLQPGQRRAQAVVMVSAEGHVLSCVVSNQPQFISVGTPEPLVPAGRGEARHHERARRDGGAANCDRFQGDPSARLHRAVVPEHFLHGVAYQGRVGAQQLKLAGVGQQRECAAGDQVNRGLVPRDVQQERLRYQFVVCKRVAVVLGVDQRGK